MDISESLLISYDLQLVFEIHICAISIYKWWYSAKSGSGAVMYNILLKQLEKGFQLYINDSLKTC